ncbi:hypothetical protein BC936DRAFT_140507 [Jimgerdemannia flammicorona]|uniref:Methyltransferase domain-containing protein n=1 Tax=Jimgerdemannia flammicorona TaxID=994334 RepID=A0A433DGU4_9FUNG|nr:hypothetical protein BC936DRAFT_140507 [Jimgerdemannia flammicorona]
MSDTILIESEASLLTDDVLEGFKTIAGRRFKTNTTYILSSDDEELTRLDLQHYIFSSLKHHRFSWTSFMKVGCGSGIWTLEMARMWPESTFVGIDIAEVFPTPNSDDLSSNCSFICANVLERLPFEDGAFARGIDIDYILEIEPLMKANCFEYIESDYISLPVGWGGRVRELNARNVYMAWTSVATMLAPILKVTPDLPANFKANKTWHKIHYGSR